MRFDYLRELHDFLQWRTGDAILLAEANILPAENLKYFGPEGDRMHMILNFQVNQTMFYAFASGDCQPLGKALMATRKRPEIGQWGIFLRTYDELDLGRLSDEQRQQVFDSFAAEAQEVTLAIPGAERTALTNLLTPEYSSPDARGRHTVALEPCGYRWFRVGPLLDVITREPR